MVFQLITMKVRAVQALEAADGAGGSSKIEERGAPEVDVD